ncbi:MAG: alanine--tRNA ligase [bacterium]|nr:alanine--tRNA ligase [bacterium]
MTSKELRQKYLDFFKAKSHAIIASASLIPENDPTTIFTGSGMQPMVPYLLGEKHPAGVRIADSQKCFRAGDIEEIGDNRHTTFFEMLGNWSLGDYFKKEQLAWMFEFLTKKLSLDSKNLYFTVFRGNEELGISRDDEAVEILKAEFKKAGLEAKAVDFSERDGLNGGRIFYYDESKNWWSRSGVPANMPIGEPGGPDSEIFWDFGAELKVHENSLFKNQPCHLNCACGRFLEIGNNVFMQYLKTEKGFERLPKGNIDFGGGLERLTAATDNKSDIFQTDLFKHIINRIEQLSGKKYGESEEITKAMRIIADHLKAATFIMADDKGITPSNTDRGYVLRRLIRRAIRYGRQIGINAAGGLWTKEIAKVVAHDYQTVYPELQKNINKVIEKFRAEEEKFGKTLEQGLKEFEKITDGQVAKKISGKEAFDLYQSYGFPLEITEELAKEKNCTVDGEACRAEMKKHQELSRTASAGAFKGGLADTSEQTKKLHTAAHLLLAALRKVLGAEVAQKGSNITAERLRFDFSYPEKMTDEQKKAVENLVNQAIKDASPIVCESMDLLKAKKIGAHGTFDSKYEEKVKVYTMGRSSAGSESPFSREICGGPHAGNTGELGHFKIKKEESSSAGVRRIKAILE